MKKLSLPSQSTIQWLGCWANLIGIVLITVVVYAVAMPLLGTPWQCRDADTLSGGDDMLGWRQRYR